MEDYVICDYEKIMKKAISAYRNDPKWDGEPFEGIKRVSNTAVGQVGLAFVEEICHEIGFMAEPPRNADGQEQYNSPWDIMINGITFELKTASEDTSGGYQFNHVRLHRTYQALLYVGVGPSDVLFNVWTKADVATGEAGRLVSMEQGGASDFKLSKRKNALLPIDQFEPIMREFLRNRFNVDC